MPAPPPLPPDPSPSSRNAGRWVGVDELFIPVEVRPDAISLVGGRAWQASALFEAMHAEAWWPESGGLSARRG